MIETTLAPNDRVLTVNTKRLTLHVVASFCLPWVRTSHHSTASESVLTYSGSGVVNGIPVEVSGGLVVRDAVPAESTGDETRPRRGYLINTYHRRQSGGDIGGKASGLVYDTLASELLDLYDRSPDAIQAGHVEYWKAQKASARRVVAELRKAIAFWDRRSSDCERAELSAELTTFTPLPSSTAGYGSDRLNDAPPARPSL